MTISRVRRDSQTEIAPDNASFDMLHPLTSASVLLYGGKQISTAWRQPMRLTNLAIRNFRCIRELSLDLHETTVLIGENNTGKTAVLEAIRICLERLRGRRRRQFDEYDYHLASSDASPTDAEPIKVRLSFMESEAEPWAEEIGQALVDVAPLGPDDRRQVTLRVSSQFDSSINDFTSDWSFLDASGEALPGTARSGPTSVPTPLANILNKAVALAEQP